MDFCCYIEELVIRLCLKSHAVDKCHRVIIIAVIMHCLHISVLHGDRNSRRFHVCFCPVSLSFPIFTYFCMTFIPSPPISMKLPPSLLHPVLYSSDLTATVRVYQTFFQLVVWNQAFTSLFLVNMRTLQHYLPFLWYFHGLHKILIILSSEVFAHGTVLVWLLLLLLLLL